MKLSAKVVAVVLLVVACVLAVVFVPWGTPTAVEETPSQVDSRSAQKRSAKKTTGRRPSRGRERLKSVESQIGTKKTPPRELRSKRRPIIAEAADLSHLTVEQRTVLNNLQSALDDNDFKSVLALAQDMQKSTDWPDKVPIELRKEALNALSWFGIKALPEITGFLADASPEVLEEAVSAYENIISDANGDAELSQTVLAAALTINDADAMESILMELNNMRPSVAVSTIKGIWEAGTDAAKSALPEAIEFLTGREDIKTPEDLDAWYNDPSGDNMDGEDAEEDFGPQPE